MAPAVRSFGRAAWSCSRQACSTRTVSVNILPACSTFYRQRRQPFSADATRLAAPGFEGLDGFGLDTRTQKEIQHEIEALARETNRRARYSRDPGKVNSHGFWTEDDEDDMLLEAGDVEEECRNDELPSIGHTELEEHREHREYARIIAWDMPSLSALAKPFVLPPQTHVLRFRQTTYMGESHPAETKVVVELASRDLAPTYLTEEQRITFLKLVGSRYNPDTDIVRMSCEKFPTRAQNKRYLGDLVNKLIKEAKEGDSYADIPLTFRHHRPKKRIQFPEDWKVNSDSLKQIESSRQQFDKLIADKGIVDGNAVIEQAANLAAAQAQAALLGAAQTVSVPVNKKQKSRGPRSKY